MADQRITQLTALSEAGLAATDVLPIADISASETKKITAKDLIEGGIALADAGSVDLAKLDQSSATKLGTTALADDAVSAAKLANNSSVAVGTTAPVTDNFDGRGYYNSTTGVLQVYAAGSYANVSASVGTGAVGTAEIADGSVTTAKIDAAGLGSAALSSGSVINSTIADNAITSSKIASGAVVDTALASASVTSSKIAPGAVTYGAIQNTTTTDVVLGRSSAGGGTVEEIALTAAGRALIDDADAAAQRTTLGLGALATATGTWTNGSSFSGTSSGTNTGDQTITLTGDVTGSGSGSFAASIATSAVTAAKIATNAVTTDKINAAAVTAAKMADNSGVVVAAATPSGSGAFIGQQWINTNTGFEYTWTGSVWQRLHGIATLTFPETTPLAFAVTYPDNFSAQVSVSLDTQAANRVFVGPASGVDAAPTFRAIVPADLPDATVSTKGIIQPGSGLSVTTGTLNHSNTVTGATVSGITFDNQGHITAATALVGTDIPGLDASKITTGTFTTARLDNDAVTGAKLANYSTAQIGEVLPIADYIGQLFFNPLDKNIYLWDGNVWQPVGVSIGELIFAGTYNANTNLLVSVTTTGSAAGLTAGQPLPTAASTFTSYYVVVSTSGTGTAPAPTVALAPPDIILCDGGAWREIDVSSTYTSQTAANVGFVAAGTISSTNVQTAVEEVATEAANAANLTSGVVAVARGGTALSSYTKGDLIAASAATTLTKLGVGSNGQVLKANSATATGLEWGTTGSGTVTNVTSSTGALTVATGTTTPALTIRSASTSVDGIVQLSDSTSTTSSALAATSTAVKTAYDLANAALPKAGGVITGALEIGSTGSLVFEGATDDTFETTLAAADVTADRTLTLPDATGNLVSTGDTGTVTGTMIADGTISDVEISATAEIAVSKLADGAARQLLQTDAAGTGVEWTSNIDIPGTLDVTGAAVFDSTITAANNVTLNAQADLRFADADSSNWVAFQAPTTVATNITWTLPSADGSANQVLQTDGTGTLSWVTPAGGGGGDVFLASDNAFTGANTFTNTTGQIFRPAATQDGILLRGRAGGTSSRTVEIIPTTLTASRVLTAPNVSGTIVTTGDTGSVTSTMIVDNTIVNGDINASAAIAFSKLASLTSGNILVGNVSNVPTSVAMSGDVTISNTGATAIAAGVIVNADINASAAIDYSKLASMTAGRVLLGSATNVPTVTALTGDVTVSSTGVTSIGAGVVVDADISASAAIAYSKLASLTSGNILVGNVSNVATSVAMSGDVTISNAGVTAIGAGVIVNADISASAAIADSKLTGTTCKAWANFNGTSATSPFTIANGGMRGAAGISSVTDNGGNGDYTLNFSPALATANYAFLGTAASTTVNGSRTVTGGTAPYSQGTTTLRFIVRTEGGGAADADYISVAIFY